MSTTGDTANSGGMNTLDLMSASVPVRYITRVMLRNRRPMTYDEICQAVENLTTEEIDGALEELVSMGWLDGEEIDGQVIYQIKVQKKEGSEVTRSRQRGSSVSSSKMAELWDAVDSGAQAAEDGTRAQREMSDYHRERGRQSGKERKRKKGGLFGLFRKRK